MWSYYGAKTTVIDRYPFPQHDTIIEPFCGTARYALMHFEKEVILVDKYDVLIDIWKWLQLCSPRDILRLPRLKQGENIDDFSFDCQEAKNLVGFLVNKGLNYPRKTATSWVAGKHSNWFNYSYKRIADNLYKIKHWNISLGSYESIENIKATWFIDPPYQHGGQLYVMNNSDIDYNDLSNWCKSRLGQAIVCENSKADWMKFKKMASHKIRKGIQHEVIWSNVPTAFDNEQLEIFT